jgi:hypothetical protein
LKSNIIFVGLCQNPKICGDLFIFNDMIKRYILLPLLTIVILILFTSCEKPDKPAGGDIVINELLPVNSTIAQDQDGEYDDWIELYNLSGSVRDISGYFLSDNRDHFSKWQIPVGTKIDGYGYLIIWADDDSAQVGLHANFKLSSQGEEILFSAPDGTLLDKVIFPGQSQEVAFARNPDGTGTFRWQAPTFNSSNNIP